MPLDLRHISNSIHLKFKEGDPGSWEIYLPSANKPHLDISIIPLFRLKLHSSKIQAITIFIYGQEDIPYPPNWTAADYISKTLGTVTRLVFLLRSSSFRHQKLPQFLKPFVHLKHLKLLWQSTSQSPYIDRLAPHLADPDFLPELESLSITACPSWPDFFQYIQRRQSGFFSPIEGDCHLGAHSWNTT